MISALTRSGWRGLTTHPWQLALATLGIVMGVTVVIGVDLTRVSAQRAMILSNESVLGRATHRITSLDAAIDEALYPTIRETLSGSADVAPVVEGWVSTEEPREALRVLGVDPLSEAAFQRLSVNPQRWQGARGFTELISRPGAVYLDQKTAERLGLAEGDRLRVLVNGRGASVTIAGWLDSEPGQAAASENLLLMDIASAQELFQSFGLINFIDVRFADPTAANAQFAGSLPSGLALKPAGTQVTQSLQMTQSFYTNLTALSLLAMLVGAFLIFNTMSFLVVQRRQEFGILRALGVTGAEIVRRTVAEALVIGAVASTLGIFVGIVLAQWLVDLVTQTINDLYYAVSVSDLDINMWVIAKALILGIGTSVAAAAIPAIQAGRHSARTVMRRSASTVPVVISAHHILLPAILSVGVGAVLLFGPAASVAAGFAGLFLVIVGFAVVTPLILTTVLRVASRIRHQNYRVKTAIACARASSNRLSAATAALMVALAAVIGIGLMILSFRASVDQWLQQLLQADVYLSVPGTRGGAGTSALDDDFVTRLKAMEQVESVTSVWSTEVDAGHLDAALPYAVSVYDLQEKAFAGFHILKGDASSAWNEFTAGSIMVSEPFHRKLGADVGDRLTLAAPGGDVAFEVAAIYRDYGSDRGVIAMDRGVYARHWDIAGITGLGLYLMPGAELSDARQAIASANTQELVLSVQDSRRIREQSMVVFDRTFSVTQALRGLAALVAVVGVFSALMALQIERAREFGVLRALGFSRGDLVRVSLTQCLLIGGVAGLVALPAGIAICIGLIYGINLRSFGWSIELELAWNVLLSGLALSVVSALVAGLAPAIKLGRMSIRSLRAA